MYWGTSYSNPYAIGGYGSSGGPQSGSSNEPSSTPLAPLAPAPCLVAPVVYGGACESSTPLISSCSGSPSGAGLSPPPSSSSSSLDSPDLPNISLSAPAIATLPSVVEVRSPRPLCPTSTPSTSSNTPSPLFSTAASITRSLSPLSSSSGGDPKSKNFKVEVVQANMSASADGPVYQIKLDLNGRSYTATRHHNKLRHLVEQLKTRGYRILSPFPEVEDVDAFAPAKAFDAAFTDLPIYENFGYSIKSFASSVFRSTTMSTRMNGTGGNVRRKSYRMEQISQRIDSFLKSIFSENEDLQYEQQVYHFFWEPLEKKLPVVVEENEEEDEEDEEVMVFESARPAEAVRRSTSSLSSSSWPSSHLSR